MWSVEPTTCPPWIGPPGQQDLARAGQHRRRAVLPQRRRPRFDDKADDNPGYYFAGRLDDFRIMNKALSADEVHALAKGN